MKNFLKNRLKKDEFLGLAFTSLVFLIIFVLFSYLWITDAILDQSVITQIDIRLSDFFYYFKDSRLINLFLLISYFGNIVIIFLVSFITSIILFIRWKKIEIIWFLSSVFFSSIIVNLSKNIIERPRPELAVYKEIWYSFPSFHSSISVALYWFIFWFFIWKIKKIKKKLRLVFVAFFIAFLIWFSRLYLNVHYFSDVIAGWYVWFLWLLLWITINWYLLDRYKKKKFFFKKYFLKKRKKIISFILILWIFIAVFNYKFYYENISFNNKKKIIYKNINSVEKLFFENKNLNFTETITWRKTEPINFIFLSDSDRKIINLFRKSWWNWADKLWRTSIKKMWKALFKNKKYDTAPITPLYYNKKIQNFSFQKLTKDQNLRFRHHIRIWKTNFKFKNKFIYVGCWIFDNGIKWGITHKIDPDLDKEREYILWSLENSFLIKLEKSIQLLKKYSWKNFSWDKFFTDWKVYILEIK